MTNFAKLEKFSEYRPQESVSSNPRGWWRSELSIFSSILIIYCLYIIVIIVINIIMIILLLLLLYFCYIFLVFIIRLMLTFVLIIDNIIILNLTRMIQLIIMIK